MSCNCIIEDILKKEFSKYSFTEKNEIIKIGRPTPELPELFTKIKTCVRKFSINSYEKNKWLAGCRKSNALFCWPCLLFCKEKSVWNSNGYTDLNNFSNAIKRHEESRNHMKNLIQLKTFGLNRIENFIDSSRNIAINQFNNKVKKNRDILKTLIDSVCFLGMQGLAFRGNDESVNSFNRGNYIELLHLLAKHNSNLASHLETSTVFSGISSIIQNDLISSVSTILMKHISLEITKADFVSLILDETVDVSNQSQLAVLLRYLDKSNEVVERFIEFIDVSADRSAEGLSKIVIEFLQKNNIQSKIVCQSYDGAAVMSGNANGLQIKIKALYPTAIFVHCFAHKLNLVLSQSCKKIKECKSFFANLSAMISFFNHSSKRSFEFKQFVQRKLPSTSQTRWEFNGRIVLMMSNHLGDMRKLFSSIVNDDFGKFDAETVATSRGFLYLIEEDGVFLSLLHFFAEIFPAADILFSLLQTEINNISYCVTHVTKFNNFLIRKGQNFNTFWLKINKEESIEEKLETRRQRISCGDPKEFIQNLTNCILETMQNELQLRFGNLQEIKFLELLDTSKFSFYSTQFPDEAFKTLQDTYFNFFNLPVLKNELLVIYSNENFREKKGVAQLFDFLKKSGLDNDFVDLSKLCKLVLTISPTTASAERSFSSMKRIKTHLRNKMGQERLKNLALISIEAELLQALKSSDNFYDDVIDHFAKKERRIELIYKD